MSSHRLLLSLNLSNTGITGEELVGFREPLINLEELTLKGCLQLTDTGLRRVLTVCGDRFKRLHLEALSISANKLAGMDAQFSGLQSLVLKECHNLQDEGFCQILDLCGGQLKSLQVENCAITGGNQLSRFANTFPCLRHLISRSDHQRILTKDLTLELLKLSKDTLTDCPTYTKPLFSDEQL